MKRYLLILIQCLSLFLISTSVLATEEIPTLGLSGDAYPLVNTPTQVMISHASYPDLKRFEVVVTYRANSSTSYQETLPAPNEDGYVAWTPKEAGIAILKATAPGIESQDSVSIEKNISVRFGGFPATGMLIFALATLVLFGGLVLMIYNNTKPPITNES